MKLKLLALCVLLFTGLMLQACAKKLDPQPSCNFVQNSDQQRVSWKDVTPVVLFVDSSFPQQFYPDIQAAMDEWNNTLGRQVLKLGGWTDTRPTPAQDGVNMIYWLSTWEDNRPNEQARTTVYWSGNEISEADVRVNAKNFTYSVDNQGAPGEVDLESLLVHEFGHALGLVHITDAQSVMAPTLASATLRRAPYKGDVDSIRCEY